MVEGFVKEGRNSVIFECKGKNFLYEKIFNTFHSGSLEDLERLHTKVERVDISPRYKSDKNFVKHKLNNLEQLVLSVTEECNFRCGYCIYSGRYEGRRTHSSNSMDFYVAKKAIDEYAKNCQRPPVISFYGGEPLLEAGLIERVVEYAKEKFDGKVRFSVTTNGSLLSEVSDFLIRNNFVVYISLDGPPSIHNKYRRFKDGRESFTDILENLKIIMEKDPDYYKRNVCFNVTISDPPKIKEIQEFFSQRLFRDNVCNVSFLERKFLKKDFPEYSRENVQTGRKLLLDLLDAYTDSILNSEKSDMFLYGLFNHLVSSIRVEKVSRHPDTLWPGGCCVPGTKKLFTSVEGVFYPCEKCEGKLPLGDIRKGIEREKILAYLETFSKIKEDLCQNCWASRICNSCIVHAVDKDGTMSRESLQESCRSLKEGIYLRFRMHVTSLLSKNLSNYQSFLENILTST